MALLLREGLGAGKEISRMIDGVEGGGLETWRLQEVWAPLLLLLVPLICRFPLGALSVSHAMFFPPNPGSKPIQTGLHRVKGFAIRVPLGGP